VRERVPADQIARQQLSRRRDVHAGAPPIGAGVDSKKMRTARPPGGPPLEFAASFLFLMLGFSLSARTP